LKKRPSSLSSSSSSLIEKKKKIPISENSIVQKMLLEQHPVAAGSKTVFNYNGWMDKSPAVRK
jgi:hypothetical protein